tara:strand:- start:346 stop:741 length:396 start_codon:yes stop_codon:yes gene_type:complete
MLDYFGNLFYELSALNKGEGFKSFCHFIAWFTGACLCIFLVRRRTDLFGAVFCVVVVAIALIVVTGEIQSETQAHVLFIKYGGAPLSGDGAFLLGKWFGLGVGIPIFSYLITLALFTVTRLLRWISDAVDK